MYVLDKTVYVFFVDPTSYLAGTDHVVLIMSSRRRVIALGVLWLSLVVGNQVQIIVGVYGEIERYDPFSSTIPSQLVSPLVESVHSFGGRLDVAVVAQQSFRKRQPTERYQDRWNNLLPYSTAGAQAVAAGMKAAFLHAGANNVSVTMYELGSDGLGYGGSIARQDPDSGACIAAGCLKPHDTPSVRAHLYARYRLLLAVRESERAHLTSQQQQQGCRQRYDWVVVARNDGRWFGPVKGPKHWPANTLLVKKCASWSGLNDKFAVVPRLYLDALLDTQVDLQNSSLAFSSVETLMLAITQRDNMQVRQDVFS